MPHELLKTLYETLVERTGLDRARVGGMTVNRFCSSSIDAMSIGALKIAAGQEAAVVAGGIEMMSRVPMLADQARVFSDPPMRRTAAC